MSSRALRKAQREKEEQELLKRLEQEAHGLDDLDAQESEEDQPAAQAPQRSAFALLQDEEDGEDEEDAETSNEAHIMSAPRKPASKKKKKKKQKAKAGIVASEETTDGLDEIDAALKSLATNGASSQPAMTSAARDPELDEACKLLAIDTSYLHAENEMRQLFGRTARDTDDDDAVPAGGNRRFQRRMQHGGLAHILRGQQQDGRRSGLSATLLRRNIFMQGKEEWPQSSNGGLSMELEEKYADGTVLYRFAHNPAYRNVQMQFDAGVESMDPNQLVHLLRENPYHISSLLQVSDIALSSHDNSTAGMLVERALFAFGRAVHSTFAARMAEGKARLDFRKAENREFWLAGWKYIQILKQRATWRTAYEWGKLLLSLSPIDDPYAIWLILDQLACRSRQDLDFINLSRNSVLSMARPEMPNIELSQALLEYRAGNPSKGKQLLFKAAGRYPWIVARILQEINIDAPPAIWGEQPRSDKERLHSELYATRAKDIWITPEASAVLQEVACAVPPGIPKAPVNDTDITRNEARHVMLSDIQSLITLIPRSLTQQLISASDPLPPDHPSTTYLSSRYGSVEETRRAQVEIRDSIDELQRFFAQFTNEMIDELDDSDADNGDTVNRILQSVGTTREEFDRNMQRIAELDRRARQAGAGIQVDPFTIAAAFAQDGPVEDNRQARVEDASDEDE